MRNPKLALTSNPPLEREKIVRSLTIGTTGNGNGSRVGATELLSAHVTGLASQQLEQWLDIDNLDISGNLFSLEEEGAFTYFT